MFSRFPIQPLSVEVFFYSLKYQINVTIKFLEKKRKNVFFNSLLMGPLEEISFEINSTFIFTFLFTVSLAYHLCIHKLYLLKLMVLFEVTCSTPADRIYASPQLRRGNSIVRKVQPWTLLPCCTFQEFPDWSCPETEKIVIVAVFHLK